MRVALIYPPSMPPTSPPCGISYLKGFLHSGKAFDLNLAYHETAVHMLNKGVLPVEAEINGYVLEPEHLKKAVNFFKGTENFYDQEEYNRNIQIFLNYFGKINTYVREECMKYLFADAADDEALTLLDQLLSPVTRYHPDLVGFSQMILQQREFILGLAKMLKAEGYAIVVGGASLSQHPECYVSSVGVKTKVDLSGMFDAAFYGEGELPLKAYTEGEPLEKIPNVVYKRKKGNKIVKNEETGLEDLDKLPVPDFEDFPLKDYYVPEVVLPLLTSRGCYWMRCTFCIHHSSYYSYRIRSVEKVVSDVRELQKIHQAHYFVFADEMIHPKRFDQLSSEILKEGLEIRYYTEVKPTREFTEDLLRKMYDSGVRALLWGVESGTQRVLDVIDKGTTVPDIEHVLKDSCTAGIWNMIFMIIGYPTQTEEEVKNDIVFLQRNQPYISTFTKSMFQLESGSIIYENPEKFDIAEIERNPDPFSTVCRYKVSKGLSNREALLVYRNNTEKLVNLSKISPHFGKLRDHMVLVADHMSGNPLK